MGALQAKECLDEAVSGFSRWKRTNRTVIDVEYVICLLLLCSEKTIRENESYLYHYPTNTILV